MLAKAVSIDSVLVIEGIEAFMALGVSSRGGFGRAKLRGDEDFSVENAG